MRTIATRSSLAALASAVMLGLAPAAWAASVTFSVPLSAGHEVPPVQTAGSGTAQLTYDAATREVTWSIQYKDLSGPVTMAHFHGPAEAGKNAGVRVWLTKQGDSAGVSNPITGHATLDPQQAKEFMAGQWYVNLHTKNHPGGEIRGQIEPPKN